MVQGKGPLLDLRASKRLPRIAARVLVVHSDEPTRQLLVDVLSDLPASVEVCEDGESALRLLDRRPFDLVIIGEWLAGIRGSVIADKCLRGDDPAVVVLLDTDGPFGLVEAGSRRQAARVSCPFSPAAFLDMCRERVGAAVAN